MQIPHSSCLSAIMVTLSQLHRVISGLSIRTRVRDGRYEAPSAIRATNVISSIANRLYRSRLSLHGFSNYTELAIAVCNDLIRKGLIRVIIPSDTRYVSNIAVRTIFAILT